MCKTRKMSRNICQLKWEWEQAKLPIPMGGVGMRAAEDHGPMAHAMSLLASRSRVRELVQPEEAGGDEEPPFLPAALLDSISSSKLGHPRIPAECKTKRFQLEN